MAKFFALLRNFTDDCQILSGWLCPTISSKCRILSVLVGFDSDILPRDPTFILLFGRIRPKIPLSRSTLSIEVVSLRRERYYRESLLHFYINITDNCFLSLRDKSNKLHGKCSGNKQWMFRTCDLWMRQDNGLHAMMLARELNLQT